MPRGTLYYLYVCVRVCVCMCACMFAMIRVFIIPSVFEKVASDVDLACSLFCEFLIFGYSLFWDFLCQMIDGAD